MPSSLAPPTGLRRCVYVTGDMVTHTGDSTRPRGDRDDNQGRSADRAELMVHSTWLKVNHRL